MRTRQWLVLVSGALFVSSIALVIAGARTTRAGASAAPAVQLRPTATVKQIMNGIVVPASTVLYDAVSSTATLTGVEERAPSTDEEWATLAANAATLVEAGNLLLLEGHAVDSGQWVTMTREFMDAGAAALKAAEARSTDGILSTGSDVNATCDKCHQLYQR
ncbi:MAG: hypothetical protein ABL986_17305 [Vicinamibacterales bacterium]